ncbi:MAG: alpha-L-rhamnosidase C-terminal domain-containing protein, partial [Eubacteriales bacterium]
AYRLLENEEMPGWLFMPKMNANTIWESWEGTEAQGGIASLDHYSKGAVCEWIFDSMCGINVGEKPNSFVISPMPGGTLTHASARYRSIYGEVQCAWTREGGETVVEVVLPPNTTALIRLPNGEEYEREAGTYRFSYGGKHATTAQ